MAIDNRLFNGTKHITACRSKRQNGKNYHEKRGALGFRGNSQPDANCQENDFVAIDCRASRVTKKQTENRGNRLNHITATAYINHGGGTRSKALTKISAALIEWCGKRGIVIEAVHLQGKLNVVVDEESRAGPDAGDWRLKPSVFKKVQGIWWSRVDVFASHWNAQLSSYMSWRPQPQAMGTNAFSFNWKSLSGYIPPLCAYI